MAFVVKYRHQSRILVVENAENNNSLTRNHRWNRSNRQSRALQINDSFNIDALNWTVWIQIDWYVEADFERGILRSILPRQLFYLFYRKQNEFSTINSKSIFKIPIFATRTTVDKQQRITSTCAKTQKWEN